MKPKRVWSDEQRRAAAERCRERFTKKPVEVRREVAPEVQAVIATMDPVRLAKLAEVQARTLSSDDPAVVAAVARHELVVTEIQQAQIRDERRVGSYELRLIVKTDGTMVSPDRPCLCGRAKREWHAVCVAREPNL